MSSPISDSIPWATLMIGILVGIAAIAGGVVVIVNSDALSFQQYLDLLKNFAIAVGILGVGRGIVSHGKSTAEAAQAQAQATDESALYGSRDYTAAAHATSNGADGVETELSGLGSY